MRLLNYGNLSTLLNSCGIIISKSFITYNVMASLL